MEIKAVKLHEQAALPTYATEGSAGADLYSLELIRIVPGGRVVVRTGIALELPVGYEAQVRSRSGLAAKNGVSVLNSPGTIDSDYRGEVKVILHNHGTTTFTASKGSRIAQLVIQPVVQASFVVGETLTETERGGAGFGSTGE